MAWPRAAALAGALLAVGAPSHAGSWDHPRGDAANTGFADVATAPAVLPQQTLPNLGIFVPGAGPVIGPDGTVYIGNFQGELRAIRPDGSQAWSRTLLRGQSIIASPVIGADGSVYVVGTARPLIRDHRGGSDPQVSWSSDSTLYRFGPGGVMAWASNFPETHPGSGRAGRAPAAPNIWRSGPTEVIIIPALYDAPDGQQVRLAAFSSSGALLFDQLVTRWDYGGLTAGDDCWYCPDFTKRPDPPIVQAIAALGPLRPAVAMFARSGEPEVVVADDYQNVVGFAFSPATGFRENFRKHFTNDSRGILMSAPVVLRDGHSVLSAWTASEKQTWLLFAGPHPVNWSEIVLPELTTVSPTLTTDGRILTLAHSGVTATQTYPRAEIALTMPTNLNGRLAPAAASRTYVYISTAAFLVTLDARTLQIVASYDWQEGGISSPAIGADGRVYAIAGETLFVFPPPRRPCPLRVCPGDVTAGGGPVFHSQQGPSAQAAAKTSALSSGGSAQLSTAPK